MPTLNPINAAAPLGSPVTVQVPQSGPVSSASPPYWRTSLYRDGATPITVEEFVRPSVPDAATPFYDDVPINGPNPPRPSEAPRLNPVNQGSRPPTPRTGSTPVNRGAGGVSGGRTPNPGMQVNPRIPGGAAGAASVGAGLIFGGGGAFERVGGAVGGYVGFNQGAAAGAAAGATAGTVSLPGVGTVGLGTAGGIAGGIAGGAAGFGLGSRAGRAIDNAIPDLPMPWPFNGGQEEYPNQTDPAALGQGPQTDVGSPPPFTGGQSPGVSYRVTVVYSDEVKNFEGVWSPRAFSQTVTVTGPVQGVGNVGGVLGVLAPNPVPTFLVGWPYACSSRTDYRNCEGKITAIVRADGQPDTGGNPAGGTAPTYAPNPARGNRQPTTPGLDPNLLPAPSTPDYPNWSPDSGNRWPETPATSPPDTQPFPPAAPNNPAAAPVGFTPTAPTTAPNTPTNPNAPPGPPDLDPNAPPRPAPDLATDPDTPAPAGNLAPVNQPDVNEHGEPFNGWIINGQKQYGNAPMTWGGNPITNSAASVTRPEQEQVTLHTPFNVPPVLPVPIPVGQRPPVNTPSAPRLTSNPADNPNVQYVEQPVIQTPPEGPKGTCFYEFQRVADIQAKATATQQQASNPTTGFTGLYGIGIESRVKLGETFTLLQTVNNFMQTAWRATRMDKVLNLLTFIGVMHNVGMLSRDVGSTFLQLVSQALQAVGIRDEEDNPINVEDVVGDSIEMLLRRVFGNAIYEGVGEAWNKANRIISSASAIIWTVRSIADSSLDLMEWIGENTGRIGNALKRWGVVGERSYPWMSESAQAQGRWRSRFSKVNDTLENAEDRLSVYMQATSTVIELQEETQELGEQWGNFRESVEEGIPDPWADNGPIADQYAADQAVSDGPDVPPAAAQKGS